MISSVKFDFAFEFVSILLMLRATSALKCTPFSKLISYCILVSQNRAFMLTISRPLIGQLRSIWLPHWPLM